MRLLGAPSARFLLVLVLLGTTLARQIPFIPLFPFPILCSFPAFSQSASFCRLSLSPFSVFDALPRFPLLSAVGRRVLLLTADAAVGGLDMAAFDSPSRLSVFSCHCGDC